MDRISLIAQIDTFHIEFFFLMSLQQQYEEAHVLIKSPQCFVIWSLCDNKDQESNCTADMPILPPYTLSMLINVFNESLQMQYEEAHLNILSLFPMWVCNSNMKKKHMCLLHCCMQFAMWSLCHSIMRSRKQMYPQTCQNNSLVSYLCFQCKSAIAI